MHDVAVARREPGVHMRTEQVHMDAARAAFILRNERWARQRLIRPSHIRTLLAAFRRGEIPDMVIQFCQTPDGRRYLVDGQHRLSMLVEADGQVAVLEITYYVEDEDEIELRYLAIDRQSRRTPEDMLLAAGLVQDSALPPTTVKRISRAALIVHANFASDYQRVGLSLIARRDAALKYMVAGEMFAAHLEGANTEISKRLWRASVASVGIATVSHVLDGRAGSFWQGIARDDGLPNDDPRKVLLTWLRANTVGQRGSDLGYTRYVVRAWNAWYEARTLSKLQGPRTGEGRPAPTPILGTPYRVG